MQHMRLMHFGHINSAAPRYNNTELWIHVTSHLSLDATNRMWCQHVLLPLAPNKPSQPSMTGTAQTNKSKPISNKKNPYCCRCCYHLMCHT